MNGFNPNVKVSIDGEAQAVFLEQDERLATPLEQKIMELSPDERQELLQDAYDKYNELEQLIHTITGLEKYPQDTLF